MGLTFGPATGGSYVYSYHAHSVDEDRVIVGTDAGMTPDGHEYRCIH